MLFIQTSPFHIEETFALGLDFAPLWEVGNSNVHAKTRQGQDTHAGRPPARAIGHSGDVGRPSAGEFLTIKPACFQRLPS